jgi:hypothetical protein
MPPVSYGCCPAKTIVLFILISKTPCRERFGDGVAPRRGIWLSREFEVMMLRRRSERRWGPMRKQPRSLENDRSHFFPFVVMK